MTYIFAWDATEKTGHADYLLNQGVGDGEPGRQRVLSVRSFVAFKF